MPHVIVKSDYLSFWIKVKQSLYLRRGLADQLEGNEEEHEKYRDMVVKFIRVRVSSDE